MAPSCSLHLRFPTSRVCQQLQQERQARGGGGVLSMHSACCSWGSTCQPLLRHMPSWESKPLAPLSSRSAASQLQRLCSSSAIGWTHSTAAAVLPNRVCGQDMETCVIS